MRKHRSIRGRRLVAIVGLLALAAAACGGGGRSTSSNTTTGGGGGKQAIVDSAGCPGSPTAGVSGSTITFGTSLPESGLYSAFSEILKGEQAYLDYLNQELGGVEVAGKKYQVNLVAKDDAYDAQRTVENVTSLVNDDGVFGLFNVVGTKNNLAIRDFVNQRCVPNLFAATGSPAWGNPKYPWLIGSELVPYPLEAKAFFDYLQKTNPDAKVAILRASDDFGRAYSETFRSLIKGSKITVVKEETYNPEQSDTKSQVTSLAASNADSLILGATLLACPDALKNVQASGWKPVTYMSGTCTSKTLMALAGDAADGVLSVADIMEPGLPKWQGNSAMKLYMEKIAKYAPDADAENGIVAYGWTTGALLAETLQRSKSLTRQGVMEAARTLDVSGVGLLMPGVTLQVDATDRFLGEMFTLAQYSSTLGHFELVGNILDFNGETAKITPKDLITG
jgi:branched-chain amino acid transport system substrate-binding protein